jgi:glutamate/tyrosine decarboxylase-like PLP-dependent enzyme
LGADRGLPETGADASEFLPAAADLLFDHSLFNAHPRFFGYITAPPSPIGIFGDFLASAVNANVGSWQLSPAATEIELQTVRWIAELIGFPADCGGLLVSGGNMANFVCFFAARAAKAPWNVREAGMPGGTGRRLIVYASAETHTWIQKATDLSGLGTAAIRWIPTDADLRMDVGALNLQIDADAADGGVPFMVVGTGGSVSTGAVDPLPDIGRLCRDRGLWFHVDGAYGGFAAAVPDAPDDLRALTGADSVAVDPHKWLYAPLEAGCVLVRDRQALIDAFAYRPPYYHFDPKVFTFNQTVTIANKKKVFVLARWQLERGGFGATRRGDLREGTIDNLIEGVDRFLLTSAATKHEDLGHEVILRIPRVLRMM